MRFNLTDGTRVDRENVVNLALALLMSVCPLEFACARV